MPKVGTKRFAYTPAGEAEAKRYASKTGKKMTVAKPVAPKRPAKKKAMPY